MLAYDADFLYVAIRCRRAAGSTIRESAACGRAARTSPIAAASSCSSTSTATSPPSTAWPSTTADSRPRTCWGDPLVGPRGLSPPGRKAVRGRPKRRSRSTSSPATIRSRGSVWAIGLRQIIPGVGLQSWSMTTAGDVRPEQFGYLIFQRPPPPRAALPASRQRLPTRCFPTTASRGTGGPFAGRLASARAGELLQRLVPVGGLFLQALEDHPLEVGRRREPSKAARRASRLCAMITSQELADEEAGR